MGLKDLYEMTLPVTTARL